MKHHINLTQTQRTSQTYRRIPPIQYDEVNNHIRQLLDHGVIIESSSSFAAPIV